MICRKCTFNFFLISNHPFKLSKVIGQKPLVGYENVPMRVTLNATNPLVWGIEMSLMKVHKLTQKISMFYCSDYHVFEVVLHVK